MGKQNLKQKFEIGQVIKHVNDPDSDAGKIVGFSYQIEHDYLYTIALQDWDPQTRTVVEAVKHIHEDEAVEVEPEEEEAENE